MAKSVKLADIAKQCGVSTVTVSKALSGQKGVSEEMREKIVQLANELGYKQPSAKKTQEVASKSYNIAVLIHERYLDKYDSFYFRLYQNIASNAVSVGSFTTLEVVTNEAERSCTLPLLVQENKADGVIIMGEFSQEYLEMLIKSPGNVPFVYLDTCDTRVEMDSVISDSFYGSYYMTNYLFEMGHKKIGFVGNILGTSSITDRYLGYVKSLMEHGLKYSDICIIEDRSAETGIMYSSDNLELPKNMPTAFVCNCDLAASVLIKRLEDDGYNVPDDFSVVGYDNYLFPGLCDVELTTYEVDMVEMVKKVLDIVISRLEGKPYKSGINIIEGRMIIRDSVKQI